MDSLIIESQATSCAAFYRLVRNFVARTPAWGTAIRYQTKPDERTDLTLVSRRVYGRRDEALLIAAAAGLESVEELMPEQLLVLPTEEQLRVLKARTGYVNQPGLRDGSLRNLVTSRRRLVRTPVLPGAGGTPAPSPSPSPTPTPTPSPSPAPVGPITWSSVRSSRASVLNSGNLNFNTNFFEFGNSRSHVISTPVGLIGSLYFEVSNTSTELVTIGLCNETFVSDGSAGSAVGDQFIVTIQQFSELEGPGDYMVAYQTATGNVWVGKNGVWFSDGDPATGVNPTITGATGDLAPYYISKNGRLRATLDDQTFAPPDGFTSIQAQ